MPSNRLAELINERSRELGYSRRELVSALGYRNTAKGLKRLKAIDEGQLEHLAHVLQHLPDALQLEPAEITNAVKETRMAAIREEAAREIAAFRPHAVFMTERRIPTQIVIAGLIGADRQRLLYFDEQTDLADYRAIVLERIPASIPTFGAVTGFIINFRPDFAIRYDLNGNKLETLSHMAPAGRIRLSL